MPTPMTLSDRRELARRLLSADPLTSNDEIARVSALSHQTIAVIRRQMEDFGLIERLDTRIATDGRRYPARYQKRILNRIIDIDV